MLRGKRWIDQKKIRKKIAVVKKIKIPLSVTDDHFMDMLRLVVVLLFFIWLSNLPYLPGISSYPSTDNI